MSPRIRHDRVGTLLGGKYRVGKLIGRGTMGAVFEAHHERTGRAVALKILHPEFVMDPEVTERFLSEARMVAELKHPNVIDVLDMDEDAEGMVYMVLELLEGEAFSRLLTREKVLPFDRAAELLMPVMRAVAHAHAHNIVHRDLKPENIFIHHDEVGQTVPKILDFGIAKVLGEHARERVTLDGYVMGTPAYMSPEQAQGVPARIGPASDVWSMGVIWYEALSGAMPFEGPNPTALMMAVTRSKFTTLAHRLPTLPEAIASAIDRAFERDVRRRYPDMQAFLEAMQRAIAAPSDPSSAPLPDRVSIPILDDEVIVPDSAHAEETTEQALVVARTTRIKARSGVLLFLLTSVVAALVSIASVMPRARDLRPVVASPHALVEAPPGRRRAPPRPAPHAPSSPTLAGVRSDTVDASLAADAVISQSARAERPRPQPPPTRSRRSARSGPATPPSPPRPELPREHAPLTDYEHVP